MNDLARLQAVVKKAMSDPTPENTKAAMAAAAQLQMIAGHKVTAPAPETVAASKKATKSSRLAAKQQVSTIKGHSNKRLAKQKEADMDRLAKLMRLKAIVHKAMTDRTDENVKAAMVAEKQLMVLLHGPATPTPRAEVVSAPVQEASTQMQAAAKAKPTHIHGASPQQMIQLKKLVKRAMTAKTPAEKMKAVQAVAALQAVMNKTKKYKAPKVPAAAAGQIAPAALQKQTPANEKSSVVLFNLAIDGLGNIAVHAGDRAAQLAEDFAAQHHLADAMKAKLQAMITKEMEVHHVAQPSPVAKKVAKKVAKVAQKIPLSMQKLQTQRKSAERKVEKLKALQAVVHTAQKNPTTENLDKAMVAAKKLQQLQKA